MSEEHEFVQKFSSLDRVSDGVVFHCTTSQGKSIDTKVTICTPHILRFQMCPDPALRNIKGLLEIKENWPSYSFDVAEKPEAVSIDTGAVVFEVQKNPWKYVIYNKAGEVVLQENVRDLDAHTSYRSLPIGFTTQGGKFLRSNETFNLPPGENFYGFGEKFTRFNMRGQRIRGWNCNPFGAGTDEVYKHIPFFMSTNGYGIFVNTTYRITCDMGSRSLMTYSITVDDPRLDLFIIYGPSLKGVLARYEDITGLPSLPPKESFGIWHSVELPRKIDYRERVEAAVEIAEKFRELDIPVDYFMIDGMGYGSPQSLAETRAMSQELGKLGVKTGIYVAPLLNLSTEMEKEARANGYALKRADGTPYEIPLGYRTEAGERGVSEYSLAIIERDDAWRDRHNRIFYTPCLMPDFTNPAAVKWWKGMIAEHMRAGCFGIGMSDFGEDVPADACYHNGHSGLEMHNLYTLLYQKASYEAVAESTGHRGLVNARSGTAGMQRFPICWSGDPNCEWEDLSANLRSGLSIGLSGVPFWSCDNGGFQGLVGHLTPELWIRWSQWSMFISHVRLHGTAPARVPWTFGDMAVENFKKYAMLRYRLLPYIYSHAYKATKTGLPMMRAMVLEFQDDPNTYEMEDEYMFGDAFLVAPVFTPTNKRTVYLPEGTWYDYYTGKEYQGPTTLYVKPSLEVLPLYVRGDSIIPMGPDMAYVGEKPFNPITLDIWLCSEAGFTIYDDDEKTGTREIVGCRARKRADEIVLDLDVSRKTYVAKLNKTGCPTKVTLNGVDLQRLTSYDDLMMAERGWYFDSSFTVYAKFNGLGNGSKLILQTPPIPDKTTGPLDEQYHRDSQSARSGYET